MNYYTSKEINGQYFGYIYTYDATGNHEKKVWLSPDPYRTPEAAIDAAVEYAEENNIEVELG